jgi:hypothetical protein
MYLEINDTTRIGDIEQVFSNFIPIYRFGFIKDRMKNTKRPMKMISSRPESESVI